MEDNKEQSQDELNCDNCQWSAVALWSWDVQADLCAICRNHIKEMCIECESKLDSETDNDCQDCPIASGACNHEFHYHCISRWLKKRQVCPIDYRTWDYQKCVN